MAMGMGMPLRRKRSAMSAQTSVVAVCACLMAITFACSSLFTAAPLSKQTQAALKFREGHGVSAVATSGWQSTVATSAAFNGSVWPKVCAGALLFASAVHALRVSGAQRKTARCNTKRRAAVCYAPPAASAPAAAVPPRDARSFQPDEVTSTDVIGEGSTFSATPQMSAAPIMSASNAPQAELAVGWVPSVGKGSARRRGSMARRVGAARCRSARRATTSEDASGSAERRHIGARLQQTRCSPDVVPPAFDPSRLRTRVQLGLRYKTNSRSASARESKTASTNLGSMSNSRLSQECRGTSLSKEDEHCL